MDRHGRHPRSKKHQKERLKLRRATRGGAKQRALSRLLGWAGLTLALVALALLINYLVQAGRARQMQEEQRALYRQQQIMEERAARDARAEETPGPQEEAAETSQVSLPAGENQQPVPEQPEEQTPLDLERQAMADRFLPLLRRNGDTVGWLSYAMFPEMDFVVVQRDNQYYMYRGFSGEKNVAGTVFLDETNRIRPRDQNLILHGHNMRNGTMFGRLNRLLEPSIIKAVPFLSFDTLYQDAVYVPYAITIFSVDPRNPRYFDAIQTNFADEAAMGNYVNWLRRHSALDFPTQVSSQDRLLTLITCHGNDDNERLALALRAVRPGEDRDALALDLKLGIMKP